MNPYFILILALSITWIAAAWSLLTNNNPAYINGEDYKAIADGAYYLRISQGFWFENLTQIYKLDTQIQLIESILGDTGKRTMPVNILPSGMLLFLPFAWIANFNFILAWDVWLIVSLGIFLASLVYSSKNIAGFNSSEKYLSLPNILWLLVTLAISFSYAAYLNIVDGQTTFLVSAALIFIISTKHNSERNSLLWLFLLLILSVKPQFLCLGLTIIIIRFGYSRIPVYALALLLIFALPTWFIGIDWVPDYLTSLGMFSGGEVPKSYLWAFSTEHMALFSPAFSPYLGEKVAKSLSAIFLLGCFLYILFRCWQRPASLDRTNSTSSQINRIQHSYICLAIGAYLLFAPHSGSYEEVLFAPFIFAAYFSLEQLNKDWKKMIFITTGILLFIVTNREAFSRSPDLILIFWCLKFTACLLPIITPLAKNSRT